jgi:hypothetical protein
MYHETFLRLLRRVRSNEVSVSHSEKHESDYSPPVEDSDDDSHAAELIAGKVDGASIGFEELSLSVLMVCPKFQVSSAHSHCLHSG